ncbi:MAG: T9SS type A sorting domain-containing protein [Bacteroidetes bacterium]|nr:T9SS type A sorting domain-containing protein [Bacteroidota bacterium]
MREIFFICSIILLLFSQESISQFSFIGFDKQECFSPDTNYTFETIECEYNSTGYRVFKNETMVFEKCENNHVVPNYMKFINETTGFLIESNGNRELTLVYKTNNSGYSWQEIGVAGWYSGYQSCYIVNPNTIYTVMLFGFGGHSIYIHKTSDVPNYSSIILPNETTSLNDTIINDPIFGSPLCDSDSLIFMIKYNQDTISLRLNFVHQNDYIKDNPPLDNLRFYPNPTSDYFSIDGIDYNSVIIYNYHGSVVKKIQRAENLYIGDLFSGIYIVEIIHKKGRSKVKMVKN